MSNTLNGINLAQIANRSLNVLQARPTVLQRFAADFSNEVMGGGQTSITTRYVVAPTAQDISSGWSPTAVSTVSRTITMNALWGYVVGLTDQEIMDNTISVHNLFETPATISTVNKMENLVFATITNAAYSQKQTTALAAIDSDTIISMAQALDTANAGGNRVLVILPTVWAALMKDSAIKSAAAYGSPNLPSGVVARIAGLDVIVNNNIPDNSENLVGFACSPEAIAVACRGIVTPANFPGAIENVTDPSSGIPLQYRYWYNPDAASQPGSHNLAVAGNFGYQIGVPANLVRLVTA